MIRFLLALICLVCAGCLDSKTPSVPPPPPPTEVTQLDGIMKDTADDLELGAKVRLIVEKQKQSRIKTKHEYDITAILYGAAFIVGVAIIHQILNRAKKS